MKKTLLLACISVLGLNASAQVIDTVYTGAGYANQVWYSLANDNQATAPKTNWDLAFDVSSGFSSTILINSPIGVNLWAYPGADTSAWSTVDTTGINWAANARWNSDTSWAYGAMGNYANPSNPYDLDWGVYNPVTHVVGGDSIYIIKLANGSYKKLHIINLNGGTYNFRYADLNGANLQTSSITKTSFTNKNFGYYSLQNNASVDNEPATASWDLLFGQYTTFIPTGPGSYMPYGVTGVLSNKGVSVAEATNIANTATYVNWNAHTFHSEINTIGYDWKTYAGTYVITDSLVYFVKTKAGDIWKMIFTGFTGSSTGGSIFSKQLLSATGIENVEGAKVGSMSVYPNPSNGATTTVVYNFEKAVAQASLRVTDVTGRIMMTDVLETSAGLHQYTLQNAQLNSGIYFVTVELGGARLFQKLVIR